jgi:hypothetical protein
VTADASTGNPDPELITALEDKRHKWRTVRGLSKELGVPELEIEDRLRRLINQEIVITSSVPDRDGNTLYTTRKHFKENSSVLQKLSAALRNRAD